MLSDTETTATPSDNTLTKSEAEPVSDNNTKHAVKRVLSSTKPSTTLPFKKRKLSDRSETIFPEVYINSLITWCSSLISFKHPQHNKSINISKHVIYKSAEEIVMCMKPQDTKVKLYTLGCVDIENLYNYYLKNLHSAVSINLYLGQTQSNDTRYTFLEFDTRNDNSPKTIPAFNNTNEFKTGSFPIIHRTIWKNRTIFHEDQQDDGYELTLSQVREIELIKHGLNWLHYQSTNSRRTKANVYKNHLINQPTDAYTKDMRFVLLQEHYNKKSFFRIIIRISNLFHIEGKNLFQFFTTCLQHMNEPKCWVDCFDHMFCVSWILCDKKPEPKPITF